MAERLTALAEVYRRGDHGTLPAAGPGIELVERRPLSIVQVAALGSAAPLRAALQATLGLAPAAQNGTAASAGNTSILWVGPGRWFVVEPEARDLAGLLQKMAESTPAAVTDLGHGRTVVRIRGRRARDLLGKGVPLDLHPRAFPAGSCGQTLVDHIAALVHNVDGEAFDTYVARGFAQTYWEWLVESAEEYGVRVGAPAP